MERCFVSKRNEFTLQLLKDGRGEVFITRSLLLFQSNSTVAYELCEASGFSGWCPMQIDALLRPDFSYSSGVKDPEERLWGVVIPADVKWSDVIKEHAFSYSFSVQMIEDEYLRISDITMDYRVSVMSLALVMLSLVLIVHMRTAHMPRYKTCMHCLTAFVTQAVLTWSVVSQTRDVLSCLVMPLVLASTSDAICHLIMGGDMISIRCAYVTTFSYACWGAFVDIPAVSNVFVSSAMSFAFFVLMVELYIRRVFERVPAVGLTTTRNKQSRFSCSSPSSPLKISLYTFMLVMSVVLMFDVSERVQRINTNARDLVLSQTGRRSEVHRFLSFAKVSDNLTFPTYVAASNSTGGKSITVWWYDRHTHEVLGPSASYPGEAFSYGITWDDPKESGYLSFSYEHNMIDSTLYMHKVLLEMVGFMTVLSAALAAVVYGCEASLQVVFVQLAVFDSQLLLFHSSFMKSVAFLAVPAVVSDYVFHSQHCRVTPLVAAITSSVCFLPIYFTTDVPDIRASVMIYVSAFGMAGILTCVRLEKLSVYIPNVSQKCIGVYSERACVELP
jgi:hypothetical protein